MKAYNMKTYIVNNYTIGKKQEYYSIKASSFNSAIRQLRKLEAWSDRIQKIAEWEYLGTIMREYRITNNPFIFSVRELL